MKEKHTDTEMKLNMFCYGYAQNILGLTESSTAT